jgi:hypothetical protein
VADKTYEEAEAQGDVFTELTDDEIGQWSEPLQAINQEQIASMSQKTPVAQEIYDRILELLNS